DLVVVDAVQDLRGAEVLLGIVPSSRRFRRGCRPGRSRPGVSRRCSLGRDAGRRPGGRGGSPVGSRRLGWGNLLSAHPDRVSALLALNLRAFGPELVVADRVLGLAAVTNETHDRSAPFLLPLAYFELRTHRLPQQVQVF